MQLGVSIKSAVLLFLAVAATSAYAQAPANPYDYTRASSFEYDPTTGLLTSETVEPDHIASCVKTTYGNDAYGNKRTATVANCAGSVPARAQFTTRTTTAEHAPGTPQTVNINGTTVAVPQGAFPITVTNALNQTETRTYDPRFGAALSVVGPNALPTTWELDDFGRKVGETRSDQTKTVFHYCILSGIGLDPSSNSTACPTPPSDEIPADAIQFVHSEPRDTNNTKMGPYTRVYSDRLGRPIRTITEAFDGAGQPGAPGTRLAKDTIYNAWGAKVIENQPYFFDRKSSTTVGINDVGLTLTTYDVLGRATEIHVADPNGTQLSVSFGSFGSRRAARATVAYNGLTTTTTNDKNQTRVEEKNPNGKVVRVTDALNAQLAHQYDAFDNLIQTKDALQNRILIVHDIRGRKLEMTDPDTGWWQYDYNALGELVWQQNPKQRAASQQTTMSYDVLGRMTQRSEPEYQSTWSYDKYADNSACNKGVGKLCEVVSTNNVSRKFVYDSLGRPLNARTTVTSGPSFATAVSYHPVTGRLASQTYPTGLKVDYSYTSKGYLEKLILATAATVSPLPSTPGGTPGSGTTLTAGSVLWQARVINAWGKTEQQSFGNGVIGRAAFDALTGRTAATSAGVGAATGVLSHTYAWDSLGNLVSRADANGDGSGQAVTETFSYDGLNRLEQYEVLAQAIPGLIRRVQLKYNAIGSLLYKSDVGVFTYNASGPGSVRPHALASVAGGSTVNYGYGDGNGNLTSASGGKYTSLSYTSFNLPDSQSGIAGPGNTPRTVWTYDENHARIKEVRTITGGTMAGTRTTWFQHPDNAGALGFEHEVNAPTSPSPSNPAVSSSRHYLSAGGVAVGVLVSTGSLPTLGAGVTAPPALGSIALVKVEYWHRDHLGSLAATTDHAAAVTARMAYDPFGKRRFANGVYDVNGALVVDYSPATNNGADRGFTGHEHLDELGLVHMNGRLYDATLGVFLQADPLIQELDNLQSYNRYMYCVGGPLSCTDPTGYSWLSKTWKKLWNKPAFRVVAAIVVAVVLGPEGSYALIPESAGAYAGVGNAAIAGFASGAVASGNVQGAFQGMFSGMLFYGVGQAVGNAGISAAGNIVDPGAFAEAVALHAVAGCVSAAASDQKCGPGALSAAFSKAMTPVTGPLGRSDPIAGALASAIVGGTAAELGGGKFANGAVTGAFGYIFNRLAHSSTAKAYVEQLRATSPLAADMFDALAADKSTMYYFDAGPLPESSGGGTVRILNQSPSLWDRLMGRHDPLSVTVVVTVDPNATVTFTDADGQSFRPSTLRLLAHELGHAYTWHVTRGNLVAYRLAYDAAIGIENAIARQLDPKAPIRAVSDHGRGP